MEFIYCLAFVSIFFPLNEIVIKIQYATEDQIFCESNGNLLCEGTTQSVVKTLQRK